MMTVLGSGATRISCAGCQPVRVVQPGGGRRRGCWPRRRRREEAAFCSGGDAYLHPELVRLAGLTLADAIHHRHVQGARLILVLRLQAVDLSELLEPPWNEHLHFIGHNQAACVLAEQCKGNNLGPKNMTNSQNGLCAIYSMVVGVTKLQKTTFTTAPNSFASSC